MQPEVVLRFRRLFADRSRGIVEICLNDRSDQLSHREPAAIIGQLISPWELKHRTQEMGVVLAGSTTNQRSIVTT